MPALDTKPYKIFLELKKKYPTKTILVTDKDLSISGLSLAYKGMRDYVAQRFLKEYNVEVYRWVHDYRSLDGSSPQLGLVYLANDSVLQPGIEVWALIGMNARYTDEKPREI